jgi:DNA-binding CsgD family transcriptional regulator/tetratricopeptide (TPR) repeat protein
VLVGREDELTRLLAARVHTVLVTGIAGIGKTALCAAAAAEWERAGLAVRGGACTDVPYAPFIAAAAGSVDVLIVEDAHRADPGTLGLLETVARARRPMSLVITSRTDELRHLADLHIALQPLPDNAIRQLVPDEHAVRRAHGHPLLALDPDDLRRRLRSLGEDVVALLVAVDVLGAAATVPVLAEVLDATAARVTALRERHRELLRHTWLAELMEAPLVRAKALRWAGRPHDAAAELRAALARCVDTTERCRTLHLLWDCLYVTGDRAGAHETLVEARGLADGSMAAVITAAEGSWLMSQGDYAEGARLSREALRTTGTIATRAYATSTLGVCLAFDGDLARGIRTLEAARDLAQRCGSIRELTRAAGNLTYVLGSTGQHERCARVAREALRRLDRAGLAPAFSATIRYNLATSLVALGRWTEFDELDVPDKLPANKAARLLLCRAETTALRGRDAHDLLAEAEKVIDGPDALFDAQYALAAAIAARAVGQHRAAVELCRAALAAPPEALGSTEHLRLCAEGLGAVADLQAAGGRVTRLDDPDGVRTELLAAADRVPVRGPEDAAWRDLCTAEAARLGGRGDWAALAEQWDALVMPYPAAYARMRHGDGVALRRAQATAQRLGAAPLLREIERVARRARVPLLAGECPKLDTLTPREREVLELLGWGRTNREIADELVLSVRTVGLHVSHILAKLGAGNRSEAARIARDQM